MVSDFEILTSVWVWKLLTNWQKSFSSTRYISCILCLAAISEKRCCGLRLWSINRLGFHRKWVVFSEIFKYFTFQTVGYWNSAGIWNIFHVLNSRVFYSLDKKCLFLIKLFLCWYVFSLFFDSLRVHLDYNPKA